MNKVFLGRFVRAFLPMIVVFAWDALINNPLGLYGLWPDLDVPMHMIGGMVTAWSLLRFAVILPKNWQPNIKPAWASHLFFLGLVAMVTIAWEIYEFIFVFFQPFPRPMTIADSLGDMLNGLIGAGAWLFVHHDPQRTRVATKISQRTQLRGRKKATNQTKESL